MTVGTIAVFALLVLWTLSPPLVLPAVVAAAACVIGVRKYR